MLTDRANRRRNIVITDDKLGLYIFIHVDLEHLIACPVDMIINSLLL